MDNKEKAATEGPADLLFQLKEATETKQPGKETQSKAWDFQDEKISEEPVKAASNSDFEQPKTEEKSTVAPGPHGPPVEKITDKAKRSSARTAVGMLDLFQRGLFTPIINNKYKKKFTGDEISKLELIIDVEKKGLENEDLKLRNKWDRLMKKRDKKIDSIPFEETEKKDIEEAFYTYFDFKEKTLPPEWFVGMAVLNSFGKRAIDAFTD